MMMIAHAGWTRSILNPFQKWFDKPVLSKAEGFTTNGRKGHHRSS